MDSLPSVTSERYRGLAYRVGTDFALAGVFRKSVDNERNAITAVLTYPVLDLAGDFVDPAGCDFAEHELIGGPVDVEHSRTREFGGLIVAKSVHPDGTYAVAYRNLNLPDGKKARLPVGTSYFDRDNRASMQVFAMVEQDILPGVSLEFKAIQGKPLGPSPLENRQAYEFSKVSVVRYSHCATPVNPGSLVVTKSLDSLIPIIQTGKLGSETLDPRLLGVLKKSVATYTPRALVRGGFVEKAAMDELFGADPAAGQDPVPMEDPAPEPAPSAGPPTAAAAHEAAQAIKDAIEAAKQKLQASEHIKGRDKILKILSKIESTAIEELIAVGDQVTSDVGGAEQMTDDDVDPDLEPDDTDTDEEGVMKAFSKPERLWVRKAIVAQHVKRFSAAEVAPEPEPEETMEQALERIQKTDPVGWKKIQAAQKRLSNVAAWARTG